MAGVKISSYGVGDIDLTALMSSADKQRRGFCGCSLTNYDNDSLPAIAEGSIVEVNGALFEFPADEVIGGSPSDGTVYIKVIPSGDSCTAEFDNDAPTWDDEKQGWYEAATNNRYLPFVMTKDGTDYDGKGIIPKYKLKKCAFRVHLTSQQTIATGTETILQLNNEEYDINGDWNSSTYKLLIPIRGIFSLTLRASISNLLDGNYFSTRIYINGSLAAQDYVYIAGNNVPYSEITLVNRFEAGDEVQIKVLHNSGSNDFISHYKYDTSFSGYRLDMNNV